MPWDEAAVSRQSGTASAPHPMTPPSAGHGGSVTQTVSQPRGGDLAHLACVSVVERDEGRPGSTASRAFHPHTGSQLARGPPSASRAGSRARPSDRLRRRRLAPCSTSCCRVFPCSSPKSTRRRGGRRGALEDRGVRASSAGGATSRRPRGSRGASAAARRCPAVPRDRRDPGSATDAAARPLLPLAASTVCEGSGHG